MPRTPATAKKAAAAKKTAPPAQPSAAELDRLNEAAEAADAAVAEASPAKSTRAKTAAAAAGAAAVRDAAATMTAPPAAGEFGDVPLDLIDASEHNPRGDDLPELAPLAASIRDFGVVEPIVVTATDGGRFRIVAGHRRVAAARLAQVKAIPAIVRPAGADDLAEMIERMIENLQRVDLSALEEARGYARLKDLGMKQKAIAVAAGRNQGHVSKRLLLLGLPESLKLRLGRKPEEGGVTLEQAVDIARLGGRVQVSIAEALDRMPSHNFGAYTVDDVVRRESNAATAAAEVVDVVKALRGSKVTVLNVAGDEISAPPQFSRIDGPASLASIDVDAAAHSKLDCHALVLLQRPNGGGADLVGRWTQQVCTDPASHRAADDGAAPAVPVAAADPVSISRHSPSGDPAADAERAAKLEQLAEADSARRAWAADLCHGRLAGVLRDYCLRGQVRDALLGREYDPGMAADLTGMAEITAAGSEGLVEMLGLGVDGKADRLLRAALACRLDADLDRVRAFASGAAFYADNVWPPDVVDAIAFYALAQPLGYDPTEIEVAALEAIAASMPDPVRAALIEGGLIDEEPEPETDWRSAHLAAGVTETALSRAAVDGVPAATWLEPGRDTPTGRCSVCGGAAKALTMGNAGRHAPGGGSVRKGGEGCPGGPLMTIDAVAAASSSDGVDPVVCGTCEGVGRAPGGDGSALCPDCGGAGMVAPAGEPVAAAG